MDTNNANLKDYVYEPLNKQQIRVLHLQPGESYDTIFIEISNEQLNETRIADYHALSWQWGPEKRTEPIRIITKDSMNLKVQTMKIKPNLAIALKKLRWQDKIRRLWVDAICINQDEEGQEKSNQIAIMNQIYRLAKEVCVWLGEQSEDSVQAIDFVEKLAYLKDFDSIAAVEKNTRDYDIRLHLKALINLLRRGWFSRRWVVQVSLKNPLVV